MTTRTGTRRRLSRHERREQLLEAARDAFAERGYHATAMDDIADRAGVSKPVLYQHFASKDDLYLGLLDVQTDRLVRLVEEALAATEDNADRVAGAVAAYFAFVDQEDAGYRLVFASDLAADPEVRERLDRCVDACAGAIARTIRADTGLPPEEAQLLGVALTGLAQASAEHWVTAGRPVPRERAAELVAQVAWRGLGGLPLARVEASGTPSG